MGVRGPTPNPGKDQRERKYGWTTLPNVPTTAPPPPLEGDHTPRAGKLWGEWWATPMAVMWATWDAPALERLLTLYAEFWAGERAVMAEMRQLEDRFGLTPSARRRLFWQIEGVDIPAKTPGQVGHDTAPSAPAAGGVDDPRLRIVAGGKAG
jgi:hypothetical protein